MGWRRGRSLQRRTDVVCLGEIIDLIFILVHILSSLFLSTVVI